MQSHDTPMQSYLGNVLKGEMRRASVVMHQAGGDGSDGGRGGGLETTAEVGLVTPR